MATDPNFTSLVEAVLPGAPITEDAQIVNQPDVAEADIVDSPEVAKAERVSPQITSALTGE